MKMYEKIDTLLKQNNMSRKELAENCDVSYSTLSSAFSRKSKKISLDTAWKIADFFEVSIDYLLRDEITDPYYDAHDINFVISKDEKELLENLRNSKKEDKELILYTIKYINKKNCEFAEYRVFNQLNKFIELKVFEQTASAGIGRSLLENELFEMKKYENNKITNQADHVIIINGDSMSPTIVDGQEVFIKECITLDNNNIGIFIYEDEVFCKRLILDRENENIILRSDNTNYQDIVIAKEDQYQLRVLGKVLL